MKPIFTILSFLMFFQMNAQDLSVNEIINRSIKKHGGDKYQNAHYAYDFRKYHYEYHYVEGIFRYERHTKDGKIKDILTNDGFKRMEDNKEVKLTEKKVRGYSNSVNSVHYFAYLPSYLNDGAVNKRLVGESTILGKDYYKVEVTFDQEGGGDDHDDIYMYWIDKADFTMDYLAYSYHVNGGGVRFRSAYNQRNVGGIVFQDYVNYKHDKDTPVADLDELFEKNELIELSKIVLENIKEL